MARNTRVTDADYYSEYEGRGMVTGFDEGLGYYRRTNLDDIINNFIVSHIGEEKALKRVPRHEVAFWAQRAMQEFTYDVFQSERAVEIELSPSLTIALPNDYVNYIEVAFVDSTGIDRPLLPSLLAKDKTTLIQDDEYNFAYNDEGDLATGEKPLSIRRFQDPMDGVQSRLAREYYSGYYYDDDYTYFNSYYGRRFGIDPRLFNSNGEYVISLADGLVYFDSSFQPGDIVSLRYISDGLGNNDDFTKVYVPKMAEDSIYAYLLYNISKLRPALAPLVPLYKKEASAKMRNAKLRLSNYKPNEMTRLFRERAKWIKH